MLAYTINVSEEKPDHIPSIANVMTPFPWSVDIGEPLDRARALMQKHEFRHLPVTDGDELVGLLVERDVRLVEGTSFDPAARAKLVVRDACTLDAYVVPTHARLDRVLLEMARRHIGAALVVKDDRLAGIFTVTDACQHFGDFLQTLFPDDDGNRVA